MSICRNLYRYPGPGKVALAIAVCLLGSLPSRAVILRTGGSPEEDARLEAESHEAGKQQKSVVGIANGFIGAFPVKATGVYLGLAKDGRTGLVLTCAHAFPDVHGTATPRQGEQWVIVLGPRNNLQGTVKIDATKVHVHPDYQRWSLETRFCQEYDTADSEPWFLKDLAILEFDAECAGEALAKEGIRPAMLHEEDCRLHHQLKVGHFFGYGRFGTQSSAELDPCGNRIHAGQTHVSYGPHLGRTAFISWTPLVPGETKQASEPGVLANTHRFDVVPTRTEYLKQGFPESILVHSHPAQALFSSGDSGGPLFFDTEDGLRLAGIISHTLGDFLLSPATRTHTLFRADYFEPVQPHLKWIRSIQEGAGAAAASASPGPAGPGEVQEEEKKVQAAPGQAVAGSAPGTSTLDAQAAMARGMAAMAKGDFHAAADHFLQAAEAHRRTAMAGGY